MEDGGLSKAQSHIKLPALHSKDSTPDTSVSWRDRHNTLLTVGAACVAPIAYVLYVAHYSINVFDADDWSVVPFVNAALRGHLTLSALWAQHTDNRMLFPNLVFVGLDTLTRANTVVLIALSAAVFIATYALFLALYRSYQSLTPLAVLTFGIVWFSVADYQNALWAFQFAWYFILLCLIGMLYCLQRGWFVAALVLAVVASFSSLQGLILWPVGVIWLTWRGWDSQAAKRVIFWLGTAVVTTAVYFWNYTFQTTGPVWRYPVTLAEFLLIEMGEIVPGSNQLGLHELIGLALLVAAGYVVVQSVRRRSECLPVALIAFGFLFDVLIAFGRLRGSLVLSIGLGPVATPSRYTMPNLLIALAVVAYAWARMNWRWVVPSVVAGQLVFATSSGLSSASALDHHLVTGARLVVNLDKIPVAQEGCYRYIGFLVYVYPQPDLAQDTALVALARSDHLSEFSDSQNFRGLPAIPECPSH